MFGNQTWSPLDDGSTGNSDDLIGLGQWPSTRADHHFASGAQLIITWSFDNSRYDRSKLPPERTDAWEQNAQADRKVYADLYDQLMQTGPDGAYATVMESSTTLDGGAPRLLTEAEATATRQFAQAAREYIDLVIQNSGTLPPDSQLPQPVQIARTVQIQPDPLSTEVTASFQLRRKDVPVAGTVIGPRMLEETEGGGGYGLTWYSQQFQTAFDLPAYQYRLATGLPFGDADKGPQRPTLWAVRFGKSAAQSYHYALKDSPPAYFAPAPLATVPLSRPEVMLYSYTPEGGLSPSADEKKSLTDVDLDRLGRIALAGIDRLLSPPLTAPALVVDTKGETGYLQALLDARSALADAIVGGVTNILAQPPLDPIANKAKFDAARQLLRQELLMKLENAYAIDAIIQHEVAVTGPEAALAPRLYGNVVEPNQGAGARGYSAGAFRIPLAGGTSLLTYTFRAGDASSQARLPLTLEYRPTHIEHEIGALAFIDSLPAIGTADLAIPIPLRAYPATPTLHSQSALPADPQPDLTTTLAQVKEWTYRFVFARPQAAQDRIDANVRFNVPPGTGIQAPLGAAERPDLIVMLARINWVLPALEQCLATDLVKVGLDTAPSDPVFKRAQQALAAFARLVTGEVNGDRPRYGLADGWRQWVTPGGVEAAPPVAGLAFSVVEESIEQEAKPGAPVKLLRVKIAYPKALLPDMKAPPVVTFDGYTTTESVDPQRMEADGLVCKAFIYKKVDPGPEDPPYLTWEQSRAIPDRRVELAGLDALQYHNALASLQIVRSLALVDEQNPTRYPFVYRTPAVEFDHRVTPLLENDGEIEIAKVPSGTSDRRKLAAHLTALFTAFFKGSPSQERLVKLEVSYGYTPSSESMVVELPVLLAAPAEFPLDLAGVTESLAQGIAGWYGALRPGTLNARFRFDVSAFVSLSDSTQPQVRVRNLVLRLAEITDL